MRNLAIGAFALGFAATAPAAVSAQEHPESAHPPAAAHPMPAMHAPAPSYRASPSVSHRVTYHPVAHHHTTYHHVAYHHVTHHRVSAHHHHATVRHVTNHIVTHPAVTSAGVRGRPNVAMLRRNITAARRFHAGLYRAPAGYRYQRWSFGQVLPNAYFASQYWISDFLAFGLFTPPDGYVWVRYGPDALLLDEYTGEIVQVDYGLFY